MTPAKLNPIATVNSPAPMPRSQYTILRNPSCTTASQMIPNANNQTMDISL